MKVFEYQGFDKSYNKHKGTINANEGEEAIFLLMQSGIFPTELQEISKSQKIAVDHVASLKSFRDKLQLPKIADNNKVTKPASRLTLSTILLAVCACIGIILILLILSR